jgi:tRNA(fMet)-specific endonuclease VapC
VAVSRYCLDTSAYSQFRRGHQEVTRLLDSAEWVGVPAITLGELRTGFAMGGRRQRNEDELLDFLANPSVHELAVDSVVSTHYADIVLTLRKAGNPIPGNDVWIAAVAARHGAAVLTFDTHFGQISRIGCVVLTP